MNDDLRSGTTIAISDYDLIKSTFNWGLIIELKDVLNTN